MEMKTTKKPNGNGESLTVCGRSSNKNQNCGRNKSRSKSRGQGEKWWKKVKCLFVKKLGIPRDSVQRKAKEERIKRNLKVKWQLHRMGIRVLKFLQYQPVNQKETGSLILGALSI